MTKHPSEPQAVFTIVLRGRDDAGAIRGLRALLKAALRRWGLAVRVDPKGGRRWRLISPASKPSPGTPSRPSGCARFGPRSRWPRSRTRRRAAITAGSGAPTRNASSRSRDFRRRSRPLWRRPPGRCGRDDQRGKTSPLPPAAGARAGSRAVPRSTCWVSRTRWLRPDISVRERRDGFSRRSSTPVLSCSQISLCVTRQSR
jgi:hypothetical protein